MKRNSEEDDHGPTCHRFFLQGTRSGSTGRNDNTQENDHGNSDYDVIARMQNIGFPLSA
jgi:hypothetical protein